MGAILEAADRQPTYFCNDPYLARWYYGSRHNSRLRISPSLIESVAGCVLPVLILAIMEVWSARKSMKTKVIKPFVNILILKPIANQR